MSLLDPDDDAALRETRLDGRVAWRGTFLSVQSDTVRLPDGSTATREYVLHPGAVMVVPMFDDARVVLERQYRYPQGRAFIEFPAGKIDPGEPELACAQRELVEETGFRARDWHRLGTIHNAIAYSDEHIALFLARGLEAGDARLDKGEFLDVFEAPFAAVIEAIDDGRITDVKTIIGAYWTERFLRRGP